MANCDYCGKQIDTLPWNCHRCKGHYCTDHRLPENHNCPGLKKKNLFMNLLRHNKYAAQAETREQQTYPNPKKYKKPNIIHKTSNVTKRTAHRIKRWATRRTHSRFNRWDDIIKNMVWVVILAIVMAVLWTNLDDLNKIVLIILPLGGSFLAIAAILLIRQTYKLIQRLSRLYKSQMNIIKYALLIALLAVSICAYQYKEGLSQPLVEFYENTELNDILPINLSWPTSNTESNEITGSYVAPIENTEDKNWLEDVLDGPEPISEQTKEIEKAILKYTNIERTQRGIKEIKWDDKLADIARAHSLDMVENDYFSHTNLKGQDPSDRADSARYATEKYLGGGTYSVGIAENIGQMPTGTVQGMGYVGSDADSIAKAHVQSWMESTGHRENILNSQYDVIGIGVAYDGLYYTATQDFK